MITSQNKQIDQAIKELNEFLENFSMLEDQEIKLHYIPEKYTLGNKDKIVISMGDASFYAFTLDELKPSLLNKNVNPFKLVSSVMLKLEDVLQHKREYLFEDTNICNVLNNLREDSFIDRIMDVEMKKKFTPLKETLDNVLSKISLPARSNAKGFTVTDKLDAIKKLIGESDSSYEVVLETEDTLVFGKARPKRNKDTILISSHADIVSAITSVSSENKEEWYHGTYDNLGTNASSVALMLLDKQLPDNIYFAFNSEEETGRCTGATDAFVYLQGVTTISPLCIALDVTDEGFEEDRLASVEGLSAPNEIKDKIRDAFMRIEGEEISLAVAKLSPKDYTPFDDDYITCDHTIFDESIHYGRTLKAPAFSLCVPTEGYMHSNTGLDIKESAFLGYIYTLDTFLHSYTNTLNKSIISTNLEDIRANRDYLVGKTERIIQKPKFKPNYVAISQNAKPYSFPNPNGVLIYDHSDFMDDDRTFDFDSEQDLSEYLDDICDFARAYDDVISFLTDAQSCYDIDFPEDFLRSAWEQAHDEYECDDFDDELDEMDNYEYDFDDFNDMELSQSNFDYNDIDIMER